jgi:branched-chain amino acid transport system ATP-binding protein
MADVVLSAAGVSRYFGGLAAVNNVWVELHAGELHAVVGPNGAGKSTLINLLSGDLPVSAGRISYRSADISTLSMERRSRLGIGRSYQKTNIFPNFSTFENARLAAQSRDPHPLQIFSDALRYEPVRAAAARALERAGLDGRGDLPAAALSHGEQRQLEIAMVLATAPAVLLLDEPLAGMGAEESARMAQLLRALAADHAVMLVEHDMDTVFAVADRITVMANGQVLESGAPDRIRASAAVRQVYLGETE